METSQRSYLLGRVLLALGVTGGYTINGDTYEDITFAEGTVPPTKEVFEAELLKGLIEEKCDAVDALHARKQIEGFTFDGHRFEIDERSQGKISNVALIAALCSMPGTGFTWTEKVWTTADNGTYSFNDVPSFFAFAKTAAEYGEALFMRRAALKRACRAATSTDDLAKVDIESGWPK